DVEAAGGDGLNAAAGDRSVAGGGVQNQQLTGYRGAHTVAAALNVLSGAGTHDGAARHSSEVEKYAAAQHRRVDVGPFDERAATIAYPRGAGGAAEILLGAAADDRAGRGAAGGDKLSDAGKHHVSAGGAGNLLAL